jgi:hypothetical protein
VKARPAALLLDFDGVLRHFDPSIGNAIEKRREHIDQAASGVTTSQSKKAHGTAARQNGRCCEQRWGRVKGWRSSRSR